MVCLPVRLIIHLPKPVDYLSVQAYKPCSVFHLNSNTPISGAGPCRAVGSKSD